MTKVSIFLTLGKKANKHGSKNVKLFLFWETHFWKEGEDSVITISTGAAASASLLGYKRRSRV